MELDPTKVFSGAVKRTKDVTETFYTFSPELLDLLNTKDPEETRVCGVVRRIMEEASGANGCLLTTIDHAPEADVSAARRLLDAKNVVAIDGTAATTVMDVGASTSACFAIAHYSGRESGEPAVKISHVTQRRTWRGDEDVSSLQDLIDELSGVRDSQGSWATTLREYLERDHGLEVCAGYAVRIFDGPLFTQNLLTQPEGRDLLRRLAEDESINIGVIKNAMGAHGLTRLCALALKPGEVFFHPLRMLLETRYSSLRDVSAFTKDIIGNEFVRGVYQPRGKPFGFECSSKHAWLAIALLHEAAADIPNQETPYLLNLVDSAVRVQFNAEENTRRFLSQMPHRYAQKVFPEREFR